MLGRGFEGACVPEGGRGGNTQTQQAVTMAWGGAAVDAVVREGRLRRVIYLGPEWQSHSVTSQPSTAPGEAPSRQNTQQAQSPEDRGEHSKGKG